MTVSEMREAGFSQADINLIQFDIIDSGPNLRRLHKHKAAIRNAQCTIRDMENGYHSI